MTARLRLQDQVAVVTGGAHGIARAVADRFAQEGAAVGIIDIDGSRATVAATDIAKGGGRATGVGADVADSSAVRTALASLVRALGPPTVLVTNAGIRGFVSLLAEDAEAIWHRVLAVNLTGMYLVARHTVPHMIQAGHGAIVNIASTRALMSEPDGEPQGASNGGVLALTHALAISLARHKIRVNAISPGGSTQPMRPCGQRITPSIRSGVSAARKTSRRPASFSPRPKSRAS